MIKQGMLIWITGLAGSGKTTIGNLVYYDLKKERNDIVILDGDILKTIVDGEVGYSNDARRKRAYKYAALCKALVNQGLTVICCTIAMFDDVRDKNRANNSNYIEVFLDVPAEVLYERDKKGLYSGVQKGNVNNIVGVDMAVELPKNPDIVLKNYADVTPRDCADIILAAIRKNTVKSDRDVNYWNQYYSKRLGSDEPSLFAKCVSGYVKEGKQLLDVGCGNGRDSRFFISKLNLVVTGIDLSSEAINALNEEFPKDCFVCDDFTCSETIYQKQYDYIYSRFSLHAVNATQEKTFLNNAYESLRDGGYLFIEVRSINDPLCGKGEKVGNNEYIYDGHYRRFIEKDNLEKNLKNEGFNIVYAVEERGLAPYGDENPPIIRIIAQK